MHRLGTASLVLGVVICTPVYEAKAQPLGANPSAAPSDIGNASSINPAAAASDIRNPSAVNPAAAASQLLQPRAVSPSRPGVAPSNIVRQRLALPPRLPVERTRAHSPRRVPLISAPACAAGQAAIGDWQQLRQKFATCWSVPEGTRGSSVTLRFGIGSLGELRGAPMVTSTSVVPKEMSAKYKDAAVATLAKCLPLCPTADFAALLGDSVVHLRLVNDAPFPSRNVGPWMTIFSVARSRH
jgi:hypothetical protein